MFLLYFQNKYHKAMKNRLYFKFFCSRIGSNFIILLSMRALFHNFFGLVHGDTAWKSLKKGTDYMKENL